MSRSGYSEDYEEDYPNAIWLYRQAVERALTGRRGQAFLREMLAALDALPVPRLIAHELVEDGEVCALGSVGRSRGIAMSALSTQPHVLAPVFGIAKALVAEIEFVNDDDFGDSRSETPEERFVRVRAWAESQIRER